MNRRLADALTHLYPASWRRRYAAEFSAFLIESKGGVRDVADILWAAFCEHIFSIPRFTMDQDSPHFPLRLRCVRAPWSRFVFCPILLLAGAYFVACLILWSGWRIFLPGTNTPFVQIDGFAIFYFGMGRLVYYSAPILVGWGIGIIAARQRRKTVWPAVGLILIALIGGAAQVHAGCSIPSGIRHISMDFTFAHFTHTLVLLSFTVLPYLILQVRRDHFLSV